MASNQMDCTSISDKILVLSGSSVIKQLRSKTRKRNLLQITANHRQYGPPLSTHKRPQNTVFRIHVVLVNASAGARNITNLHFLHCPGMGWMILLNCLYVVKDQIAQVKSRMTSCSRENEERNRALKAEKEEILGHFQQLKGQMNRFREAERLDILTPLHISLPVFS